MNLVSVIIPVYQGESTISRAIESVLIQSYGDIEIIVVDDGSTDGTSEVLKPYQDRIRLIREKHRGVSGARNSGIRAASGDFIAFLDADDIWLPDKLKLQMDLFSGNEEIITVYGNVFFLYKGERQSKTYFDLLKPARGDVFFQLFEKNFIPFSSVIIRKDSLNDAGLFNEKISYGEDYDLLLRLSSNGTFDYIEDPVAFYRTDGGQTGSDRLNAMRSIINIKESILVENKSLMLPKHKGLMKKGLYRRYLSLALCHLQNGESEDAALQLKKYVRKNRISLPGIFIWMLLKLPVVISSAKIKFWRAVKRHPETGRL